MFVNFKLIVEFVVYVVVCCELFFDKLVLFVCLFCDVEVFEFGLDFGENVLVFVGWGVNMIFVELNRLVYERI